MNIVLLMEGLEADDYLVEAARKILVEDGEVTASALPNVRIEVRDDVALH